MSDFYMDVDFTKLGSMRDLDLDAMHLNIMFIIAELSVTTLKQYNHVSKTVRRRTQLRLIEEEIAERILLDNWSI